MLSTFFLVRNTHNKIHVDTFSYKKSETDGNFESRKILERATAYSLIQKKQIVIIVCWCREGIRTYDWVIIAFEYIGVNLWGS